MKQTCNICGNRIETGGYGGLPMKQHYKHKHPDHYYGAGDGRVQATLETFERAARSNS